jgi:hypothetical protein
MKRLLLMGEVASLSVSLQRRRPTVHHFESIEKMYIGPLGSNSTINSGIADSASNEEMVKNKLSASSLNQKISEILDEWDEPELQKDQVRIPSR